MTSNEKSPGRPGLFYAASLALGLAGALAFAEVLLRAGGALLPARAASPGPPGAARILCVGDSFTYGVGARVSYPVSLQGLLDAAHPGRYHVINRGRPSLTSKRVAAELSADLRAERPAWVVFWIGSNDLADFVRAADLLERPRWMRGLRLVEVYDRWRQFRRASRALESHARPDDASRGFEKVEQAVIAAVEAGRFDEALAAVAAARRDLPDSRGLRLLELRALAAAGKVERQRERAREYLGRFGADERLFQEILAVQDAADRDAWVARGAQSLPGSGLLTLAAIDGDLVHGSFSDALERFSRFRGAYDRGNPLDREFYLRAEYLMVYQAKLRGELDRLNAFPGLRDSRWLRAARRGELQDPAIEVLGRDLDAMFAQVRGAGAKVVALGYPGGAEQAVNRAIEAAARRAGARFIDVSGVLDRRFKSPIFYAGSAGHHLNDAGYAAVAAAVRDAIAAAAP